MAGMTDSLRILITANGAQAEREFAKVGAASRRSLGMAETNAQRYSRSLTSAGIAMASFGAVALIGLGKAAQAAEGERAALLRLENSIQNMPELAGATTDAFLEQAAALQDSTRFADDATVSAQAMLGTFHMTEEQILDLIPAVQDYAAKFGVDLVTAAKQVGRAVSGSSGALTRNGIVMDEAAFAADHYGTVLAALRENAGGFAEQEGQTLSGQIEILKNNMSDLVEGVGAGAADAFGDLASAVKSLDGMFDQLSPSTQGAIGKFLTFGAVGLTAAGAMSFLAGQLMKLPALFAGGRNALLGLSAAYDKAAISAYNFAGAMSATGSTAALSTGQIGGLAAASAGLTLGMQELSSQAADAFGRLTGLFRIEVDTSFWDGFGEGIQRAGTNIGGAVGALASMNGEMDLTEQAAMEAAGAIEELQQEIQDYLAGAFDVPSAQRDLNQSFEDLFMTVASGSASTDDMAASLEAVVTNTASVVSAQAEHNASQEEMNTTIGLTRLRLMDALNANMITQEQFERYDGVLRGIDPIVSTQTETPGLIDATWRTITYKGIVVSVPPDWETRFEANTGSAIASVQALIDRIHVLNNTVVRPQGTGIAGQIGAMSGRIWNESAPAPTAGTGESVPLVPTWSVQDSGRPARALSELGGQSVGSSKSAGASIVVNIHGSATQADGQAVVDALRRWQQRNGPVPVKVSA